MRVQWTEPQTSADARAPVIASLPCLTGSSNALLRCRSWNRMPAAPGPMCIASIPRAPVSIKGDRSVSCASFRESVLPRARGLCPGFVLHRLKELRHGRVVLEGAHPDKYSDKKGRGYCWQSCAVWQVAGSRTPRPENHGLSLVDGLVVHGTLQRQSCCKRAQPQSPASSSHGPVAA